MAEGNEWTQIAQIMAMELWDPQDGAVTLNASSLWGQAGHPHSPQSPASHPTHL